MRASTHLSLSPLLLASALLVGGPSACATSSTATAPAERYQPDYEADPSLAKLIFVRHTSGDSDTDFVILDSDREHLATLRGDMHTVVQVEPGAHTFYFVADNTEQVRATLEAGRTYVIEARPHHRFDGTGVAAEAVRIERLAEVRGWVQTTPARQPDAARDPAALSEREREVGAKIEAAEKDWHKQDVFWQRKHTLQPRDGVEGDHLRF